MSVTLNGRSYALADFIGTSGYGYTQNGVTGVPLWDQFFNDLIAQLASATSVATVSPGADGGYLRSNGSAWARAAGLAPTDLSAAVPSTKGGTGLTALGSPLQVLRTNAGATAIEWGALVSGLTLVSTLTASGSASLAYTSLASASYPAYLLVFSGIVPASSGETLNVQGSSDGGSTYGTLWTYSVSQNDGAAVFSGTGGAAYGSPVQSLPVSGAIGTSILPASGNGMAILSYGLSGTDYPSLISETVAFNNDRPIWQKIAAYYKSTTEINALKFLMSSGNITRGTIRIYGLQGS